MKGIAQKIKESDDPAKWARAVWKEVHDHLVKIDRNKNPKLYKEAKREQLHLHGVLSKYMESVRANDTTQYRCREEARKTVCVIIGIVIEIEKPREKWEPA